MDSAVTKTRSVCCYCGTGCGVIIESDGERIIGVRGDPDHPANFGRLCTKGNTLHLATVRTGRATQPLLREHRASPPVPTSWENALAVAAKRFATIIRTHGPDAVAFYVSGQLLTEDYYVFNKLARALVGTNNIDSNSRLCMSSAVAAYKATLGSDAVPCCYSDIDLADLFLIAGSNTAYAHPVLFRRIEAAREKNPDIKLLVVDPRRTDTALAATRHLAITPGSDALLYSAMLHVLLWEGMVDHDFIATSTSGFDALRTQLAELTPGAVAFACGLKAEEIVAAARMFGQAKAPLSFWCQGLNQSIHGTSNGAALIHLHLATGKIGKPGMGPFSLTGQPNAMGGRETGTMANLLPGHRNINDPADRAELAALWGIPALPETPGKTAVEIFDALTDGTIKAVWIACTNPAQSLPNLAKVKRALTSAEFVVVQEAWSDTETAAYADLLLPAATWGEKEGTVTNSERRISRVRAAVPPPGAALPDWQITVRFARALGQALGCPEKAERLFPYRSSAEIYAEYVTTTIGRDLDIGTLSHETLDCLGPVQWPVRGDHGTERLYTDHRFAFPDGKARFVAIDTRRTAEAPDARHPFRLITGRLRDQWHGMSRTGRIPRLFAHEPEPRLVLHPADLARRGWQEGQLMRLKNPRGEVVLPVAASETVRSGEAFVAMHWGARSLAHDGINTLTTPTFDPISKQPELKHTVVRIEPANLPWHLVALRSAASATNPEEAILVWSARLRPLLAQFDYASLTLDGRDRPLVVFRLAQAEPLPAEEIEAIARLLDMADSTSLTYCDLAKGVSKRAVIEAGCLTGILLAGETQANRWLQAAMRDGLPIDDLRRWIFSPLAEPPVAAAAPSRIVCSCFGVSEAAIRLEIATGAGLAAVQERLKCGTSCGSCLPEIRQMVAAIPSR